MIFITPWVLRLLIANLVVFGLQYLRPVITNEFAFLPALILLKPWTIITYMFLHGDIYHILFNMLGLFFFGPRMEMHLGSKRFLGLYFVSGFVAALMSFMNPFAPIIGASGAIYGVFLGFAYYWPKDKIYIWGVLPVEARWMVVGLTALSLFGGFSGGGNIAHFAHLGGFLGGFVYLRILDKTSRAASFEKQIQSFAHQAGDMQRWEKIDRERLHIVNREEFDRIMEKIKKVGADNLTMEERMFMNRFSENS